MRDNRAWQNPLWVSASWDEKLDALLNGVCELLAKDTKIMAAIDDLNAAVATLSTNFTAADAAIQAEIAALETALSSGNDTAVEAAATNISAISSKMATDTAALVASLPAPSVATVLPSTVKTGP